MGKKIKTGNGDIYQQEQINKKHRTKSEKLQKRIEKKRNKKKVKEIHHAKRTLFKYIISVFHQRKKNIDLTRLPLDFKEIQKTVKSILNQRDMDSVNRLLSLFDTMEKTVKEVDITSFKNKTIIKDVAKFMRVMHVQQNPKNPMKYSLYHMFRKRDPKVRYTTNVDEIIPECLSSYYLLVKCLFDYYIKEQKKEEGIIEKEEDKNEEIKDEEKEENEMDEKDKIDEEYRLIEENVGQNAELINKAFSRILNDNKKNKKSNKDKNNDKMAIEENELETDLNNIKENKIEEEIKNHNNEIKNKLKPNDFLKMTMNILNN